MLQKKRSNDGNESQTSLLFWKILCFHHYQMEKNSPTSTIGSSTGGLFAQIADGYMCSGKEILT